MRLTGKCIVSIAILVLLIFSMSPSVSASEDLPSVTVVKYADDGVTEIANETRTYQWMEDNLPVLGDGNTTYYMQGPIFAGENGSEVRWNVAEDTNLEKIHGKYKGTDVKDLCELVGGMSAGDEIEIADGGFKKKFGYENVYNPQARQGPMVLCWYKDGSYVPEFSAGIRLIFFADTSVNPNVWHVFGDNDMRECLAEKYWYYYSKGVDDLCPATSGLSVQNVKQVSIYTDEPAPEVLFDGEVSLGEGNVTIHAVNSGTEMAEDCEIPCLTPLGALDAASKTGEGFTYDVNSKRWSYGALLIEAVSGYSYEKHVTSWSCYVNGELVDDYTGGLNTVDLENGDQVNYYFGEGDFTPYNATAVVKITVSKESGLDTIFDGEVSLGEGNVTIHAVNSGTEMAEVCEIPCLTPLGALDAASKIGEGFTYDVNSKRWSYGALLIEAINGYSYDKHVTSWSCYVNGELVDDYNGGLNTVDLENGDQVNYYFGEGDFTPDNATAVVKMTVKTASAPGDWSVTLIGHNTVSLTKTSFEAGVEGMGGAEYTDGDSNVWKGFPLWVLVGAVDDDNPKDFNDELAAEGYSVKVTTQDGSYEINFPSGEIARNNGYIVANTLNGAPLPEMTSAEKPKPCWPLQMKGENVSAGQLIGNIGEIELVGLPEPSEGWELEVNGVINDTITQAEFEESGCHGVTWTDPNGDEWSGVPLWYLVAVSDNLETGSHWTFDDGRAAEGYMVEVVAGDGYSKSFASADIARNNSYIVANKLNGQPLPEDVDKAPYPLRLVGPGFWKGDKLSGSAVGNIARINLVGLIPAEPEEGSWDLRLRGNIGAVITQAEFEEAVKCHGVEWTDSKNRTWKGIPMWYLAGWVDDRTPHGPDGFNDLLAANGYKVIYSSESGYSKELDSQNVSHNNNIIVANTLNGSPLPNDGDKPQWPLRVVGSALPDGSYSVSNLAAIELTDFSEPTGAPSVTIIKYAADGVTETANVTKSYEWMENNLDVYGDGETEYKFEGLCFPPEGLNETERYNYIWDRDETYPGGFKITNAVKGTLVKDLCELAGGMGPGTEIKFVATDGWETTLNYTNIYEPGERQGDCVLTWYDRDMGYLPGYKDGYRLFFMPDDHIFGQWDMHECIAEGYWHYNSGLPSSAGLSAKYISKIKIYSAAEENWELVLDGAINKTISKGYFESGLTCTMAGNHKAEYTDNKGRVWEGMPLWLLCGFVDDGVSHVGKSYNEALARQGYKIHVIADDGFETVIDSRDTIRNTNYIIANSLDGAHMKPGDGSSWPLRLVGENVTAHVDGVKSVSNIVRIVLEMPEGAINLNGGWNFISTPKSLASGKNTFAIFNGIDRDGHDICWYDASVDQWKQSGSGDFVKPLDGFWIYSKGGSVVILEYAEDGATLLPVKELYKGWNSIGAPREEMTARDALCSIEEGAWSHLIGYDSKVQELKRAIIRGGSGDFSDDHLVEPTEGYWLYMRQDGNLAYL